MWLPVKQVETADIFGFYTEMLEGSAKDSSGGPAYYPSAGFEGGIGCNYDDLDWPDYVIVDRVQNYYSFHYGAMTVYKHKE